MPPSNLFRFLKTSLPLSLLLTISTLSSLPAQSDGDPIQYSPGHYRILHSEILQEDRTLLVSLPQGYDQASDRLYPVLFLLDGSVYAISWARGSALERGIPPLITVAIANTNRRRDFTLGGVEAWETPGGAGAFRDFLVQELIPFIEGGYRAAPYRILAGTSAGGFLTTFTALTTPQAFQGYIAASPMFVGSARWAADRLAELPQEPRGDSDSRRIVFLW